MKSERAILLDIDELKMFRSSGQLSESGEDRLAALELCAGILAVGHIEFRLLVRPIVAGRMEDCARRVGVRRATLSVYLKGESSLSSDTLEALLRLPR